MSNWTRIKRIINNLDVLKRCCEDHNVMFREVHGQQFQGMPVYAELTDKLNTVRYDRHDTAYLCEAEEGGYTLAIDNDSNWSTLTKRLGRNGGDLMRSYSEELVMMDVVSQGGSSEWREVQPDRRVLIKISIPN